MTATTTAPTASLTDADIAFLLDNGYLVKRGLAGRERAERARRLINATLGTNGIDPDRLPNYRTQTYVPEIRDHEAIVSLVENPEVRAVRDGLFDPDTLNPVGGGQIALRFPKLPDGDDEAIRAGWGKGKRGGGYHIDGLPMRPGAPSNGVPPGEVHNFACLVGVLLNDQPTDFRGNFTVWPGSHREMAAHFREHGANDLAETGTPKVVTSQPLQITGEPGDVVFAAHLLAHGIAPNLSGDVRYNCFFRFWPKHRGRFSNEALLDPWAEWKIGH